MADWYVRHEGEDPIGPVSAELLVRGIAAGKVPADAEVCEIGTDEWLPLEAIEEFQDALPDDGVQTRVIESPWFMDQTNPSTPGATLPAAYSEDDDAATRVASTPFGDPRPGVPLPSSPRPAAGASLPAAGRPAPSRPAASRRGLPPPVPSRRGAPPPAVQSRRAAAPPARSAPRAARPPGPAAPTPSAPRAAPPPKPAAPPRAPAPSPPQAAAPALAAGAARYDEIDDEAATRVAQAPSESARAFPSPRPAAGAPAAPPAPPALTPLPGAAGPAPARPPAPTAPAVPSVVVEQTPPPDHTAPPAPPRGPVPMPAPQTAQRSILPLLLLIVVLAAALAVVLYLLAQR